MKPPPIWICAPDSFKGTVEARNAAFELAAGIRAQAPHLRVLECPMADGGEGTIRALQPALGGQARVERVDGPRGADAPCEACWLQDASGWSVVEFAEASGLTLLDATDRDPEVTTSFGVGQLIRAVVASGAGKILLALGGSATIDGGVGMLQALGAVIRVGAGILERPCMGGDLVDLEGIELEPVRRTLEGVEVVAAVDVRNPLLGPDGGARIYGPQKGADPSAIERLERGLLRLTELLGDPGTQVGDGAAGGAGYGARIGLDAQLRPGAPFIAELIGLPAACANADVVVTGEGCYDEQTPFGKVAWEVARLAGEAGARSAIVAGMIQRSMSARSEDPFSMHVALDELVLEPGASERERLRAAGARLAEHMC